MSWILDITLQLGFGVAQLLVTYAVWPLVRFVFGYLYYMLAGTFITLLLKFRRELHNEDLQLQPADIKKRVLLITGAGSGIGLALAKHFLRRGFVVIACYYSQSEPGYEELSRRTGEPSNDEQEDKVGNRLQLVQLDIRSLESIGACHSFVEKILESDNQLRLHALLNVAGVGLCQKFQWTSQTEIRNLVETNLTGPLMMTRQFLHLLLRTPHARVINVSSPLGILPLSYAAVYGPTKAALSHFSSTLECDIARYGLKTVTIQPGNLIQHTGIIDSSLNSKTDNILRQLSSDERSLYGDELREHQKLLTTMQRAHQRNKSFKDLRLVRKIAVIFDGGLLKGKLQDSLGFFKNFDNSVCLWNPPREMFAGNMFYNLFVGSILQWVPRIIYRDLLLNLQNTVGSLGLR